MTGRQTFAFRIGKVKFVSRNGFPVAVLALRELRRPAQRKGGGIPRMPGPAARQPSILRLGQGFREHLPLFVISYKRPIAGIISFGDYGVQNSQIKLQRSYGTL